jgi:hypothetical protein
MAVVILSATVCCILLIAGFGVLFTKLLSSRHDNFAVQEQPFSPECYRPMGRLLDEADGKFISSHSSCNRKIKRTFRKQRIGIFRAYLRLLSQDFHRVCKALKLYMVAYKVDRSDLAVVVMKEQFRFAASMVYVEFTLMVFATGWSGVDASRLIRAVDAMRERMQSLAMLPEPSPSLA